MPITRGAVKKLRQDIKRERQNSAVKKAVSDGVKKFKKSPTEKNIASVYSLLDTAVKKNIYQKNKAARLKSRLSKLLSKKHHKSPEQK